MFKEVTKIEQYQSITKDFLQNQIDKLIIDKKLQIKSTGLKTLIK